MVEGDESSQLGIAHKPAVLAGYLPVELGWKDAL